MGDPEAFLSLSKIVLGDKNQNRNVVLICLDESFNFLWRFNYLRGSFAYCSRILFILVKTVNNVIPTINRVFLSLVEPSKTGKMQLI